MSGLRVGKYNLPVWIVIIGMVGAGSMTISSSSIVDTIDEDTIPTARTGAFTGMPVHFDKPNLATLSVSGNGAVAGAHVLTNQQLRINLLAQVADPVTITVPIKNESEDSVIMVVKVTTDSKVLVDIDEGFSTGGVRFVGTNQWIMAVDDDASADFDLNVVALEPGAFFLLVEIFSVG